MTKKKNKCLYCDYEGESNNLRRHVKRQHPEIFEEFLDYYNKNLKFIPTKRIYDFKCLNCEKEFKHNDKRRKFCSRSCSASFNNKGKFKSQATKEKIRKTIRKRYKNQKQIKPNTNKKLVIKYQDIKKYLQKNKIFNIKKIKDKNIKYSLYYYKRNNLEKYNIFLKITFKNREQYKKNLKKTSIYTKDKLIKIAQKVNTNKDFYTKHQGAYRAAKRRDKTESGFYSKITEHFISLGNRYKRCIYLIEFPIQKAIYIGLTYDYETRIKRHLANSHNKKVLNLIKQNQKYKVKRITKYLPIKSAIEKEIYFIQKYKDLNFEILNDSKGGEIGSITKKWTKEKIIKEAKKHQSYKSLFQDKSLYREMYRSNLTKFIKEQIFNKEYKPNKEIILNNQELLQLIKNKFNSYSEVMEDKKIYSRIKNRRLVKKVKEYFNEEYVCPKKSWSKNELLEIASKCNSYSDFLNNHPKAYYASSKRKLLKLIKKEIFKIK